MGSQRKITRVTWPFLGGALGATVLAASQVVVAPAGYAAECTPLQLDVSAAGSFSSPGLTPSGSATSGTSPPAPSSLGSGPVIVTLGTGTYAALPVARAPSYDDGGADAPARAPAYGAVAPGYYTLSPTYGGGSGSGRNPGGNYGEVGAALADGGGSLSSKPKLEYPTYDTNDTDPYHDVTQPTAARVLAVEVDGTASGTRVVETVWTGDRSQLWTLSTTVVGTTTYFAFVNAKVAVSTRWFTLAPADAQCLMSSAG
jgi:hypothetical protein